MGLADLIHREVAPPSCDPIDWLSSQPLYPKVYWKEQGSSTEHAAVGELLHFSKLPALPESDPHVRLYGGMRFDRRRPDPLWEGFDAERFWVPECELLSSEGKNCCIVHSLGDPSYAPHPPLTAGALEPATICQRIDLPEKGQWEETLGKILHAIAHHRLEKVVSARKTELQLGHPLSVWSLMKHLRSRAFNTTLFAFALAPDLCFFGSSPEKLFERKGVHLFTEAVAGTRRRALSAREDEELAAELLSNAKDKREFTIVKQFLERRLSGYVESFSWEGEDRILHNTHVQHIYNRLSATLHPSVSDAQLLERLHPTPALGGVPSAIALEMILQLEPFDRGWYGAPVGMVSAHRSSFAVAIRSALLEQQSLHLFAGTGIVKGSIPENEWDELEQKIHPITSLI